MPDDIRALSVALARDPSSLQYVELAEALRRRGKLPEAEQVAKHGLSRHPEHADGYDCLARIHADRGALDEARAAWERALAVAPEHSGALRGMGFLFYRQGDMKRAIEALEHAVQADPGDEAAQHALGVLHAGSSQPAGVPAAPQDAPRATPVDVPLAAGARNAAVSAPERDPVFAGLEGATADMLLLDPRGLVLAGGLRRPDGSDASELAAAALAGVSGEAGRTADYLRIGTWTAIVAEAERANLVLAPVGGDSLLLLRRDKSTPFGLALRIAERAKHAAARWLEAQSA